MKKFFTLLFLLVFGLINQVSAKNKVATNHNATPLVFANLETADFNQYFPWLEMANQCMLLACPGDIFVTTDPGECSRVITYDFDLTPEDPPGQEEVTQNVDPNLVNATIYCPTGQSRYRRTFVNNYPTDLVLNTAKLGVYQSLNNPSITVNIFSQAGDLVYTTSVIVPALNMTTFNVSLGNIVIPAGESYSMEVVTPPPFVSIFRMGRNDQGNTTNEAQITSESCTPLQFIVSGAAMANSVVMSVLATPEEFNLVNNSPYPYESGDAFPVGVYNMDYHVVNYAGDTVLVCLFDIEVNNFDGQNTAMACNDQVNIALGEDCISEVGAEFILKGDFYGCFDNYIVNLTSSFGQNYGNTVTEANIGQTLKVTVTAPDGNSCWGHILVEDKYGPQLECTDIYTTCVGDLTPGSLLSGRINIPGEIINGENILFPGAPNSRTFVIPVSGFSNVSLSNVGVHLNISHTRVSDLVATVQGPDGQMVTLFVGPGINAGPCTEDNIVVDLFDAAANTNATLLATCNVAVPAISGDFQPLTPLNIFDGISPDGNWTITVHDVSNGEGGLINDVTLSFDQQGAVIPFPYPNPVNWIDLGNNAYWIENGDNCTNAILTYTDSIIQESCDSEFLRIIKRCWGGVDEYGNVAEGCCQTIYVYRNGLSAVNFPPNYDGIQLPALSCEIYGDSIPGLDVTGTITGDFCDNIQIFPYTDVIIPICDGSYKIIRNHKILEWCNSIVLEHTQIIKVIDDEGPELDCPDDFTVSTNTYDCFATLTLDRPEVLFDCSDVFTYSLEQGFGPYSEQFPCEEVRYSFDNVNQNTRTITGFPVGVSFFKWTVGDECGNTSRCCTKVTVKDEIRPTAVCHDFTIVSIAANQQAIINVESFDDGSHDNCGIERIEVRKMVNKCPAGSTIFGPRAIFCCAEIGEEIMVEMKVTDIHGNMNTCMVRASVQDKLPPYVVCPPDITLECQADYEDYDLTGRPTAFDNCSVKDTFAEDDKFLGPCGTGYIKRVWTAVDHQGLKHSCDQIITLVDFDPFEEDDINWPDHYETDVCGAALLPENLPYQYARPIVDDDACSLVGIHYKDQVFTFVDGACEKILRTWTVLDWCTYDEQYPVLGEGWYEFVQIIKMHNVAPPVFETPCVDKTVYSFGECEGEVDEYVIVSDSCTPEHQIGVKYTIELFKNPLNKIQGTGNSFTRVLPDGTHRIIWTAEDKCGNFSTCIYLLTVVDGKKPTPYCLSSITTAVMNTNGRVEIWAVDYDLGSTDNCTENEDLWFTFDGARPVRDYENTEHYFKGNGVFANIFEYYEGSAQRWIPSTHTSGMMFTCEDIPNGVSEEILLDMSVIDSTGNIDFCTITLVLQDNADACEDQQGTVGSIAGRITLPDTRPLANTTVILESTQPEYPKTLLTSQTGSFQFTNVKKNFNYQMGATLNHKIDAGVSTLDLVFIQRHILGTQYFNNPYYTIAADIDGNEKLNSVDLVNLRKVILGTLTEFPNQQKSWRFIPSNVQFPDANAPWPISDKYSYPNFSQNKTNQNFVAVKIGDVNNSIVLNVNGDPVETRINSSLVFMTEAVKASQGNLVKIPVFVHGYKNILGYQFTAQFDPTKFEFQGIEAGQLNVHDDHFGTFENNPGTLTTSWNTEDSRSISSDEAAFYVILMAKVDVQTHNVFNITSDITQALAYDDQYRVIKVEYKPISQPLGNEDHTFELRQNVPNPFADNTVISFTIPTNEQVDFKIMDVSGKIIHSIHGWYEAGTHEFKIDKTMLTNQGVMYYQFSAGEFTSTKMMVLIE